MNYFKLERLFMVRSGLEELRHGFFKKCYIPKRSLDIALNRIEKDITKYIEIESEYNKRMKKEAYKNNKRVKKEVYKNAI